MHTDRCGNTRRQKCRAKGIGKEVQIQEFMYIDVYNFLLLAATAFIKKIRQPEL